MVSFGVKNIQHGMDPERFDKEIMRYLSENIRNIINKADTGNIKDLEEIRLRADRPLMLIDIYGDWFIDKLGKITKKNHNLFTVSQLELFKTLELMSENSIYAYQEEIKNGYITLKGGHRVGICGRTIMDKDGIRNIKDISGLNIRISREITGCSGKLIKFLIKNKSEIFNTLIISPPQCGKTTVLRDIARVISNGSEEPLFNGVKVGIVDERSEIAASYKGVAQNDVGFRTDVLDGCPKSLGMVMLLRSMSPQVIITDEIGNYGDKEAINQVLNAGVKIITTAHGFNISELKTRNEVLSLLDRKVFERYVVLSNSNGPGTIEEIVDGLSMKLIYRRE